MTAGIFNITSRKRFENKVAITVISGIAIMGKRLNGNHEKLLIMPDKDQMLTNISQPVSTVRMVLKSFFFVRLSISLLSIPVFNVFANSHTQTMVKRAKPICEISRRLVFISDLICPDERKW